MTVLNWSIVNRSLVQSHSVRPPLPKPRLPVIQLFTMCTHRMWGHWNLFSEGKSPGTRGVDISPAQRWKGVPTHS